MSSVGYSHDTTVLGSLFFARAFSFVTSMLFRHRGGEAIIDVWRHILIAHQKDHFVAGLEKLGIEDEEPAVRAAKYHYFTNVIAGLDFEYVEESRQRVWLRNKGPMWAYPGTGMVCLPSNLRREIFKAWHGRNGAVLSDNHLGYVGTKFIMEGDPYDEGYFEEFDQPLSNEERFQTRIADITPAFNPEDLPQLSDQLWPRERIVRARRNYSAGYYTRAVEILVSLYGKSEALYICREALKAMAIQLTPEFLLAAKSPGNSLNSLGVFFETLLTGQGHTVIVESSSDSISLHVRDLKYFPAALRDVHVTAIGDFLEMSVRMCSGDIRAEISHADDDGSFSFRLKDMGNWIW